MIRIMRLPVDWVVPIGVGIALGLTVALLGKEFAWSDGLVGVLALAATQVGVLLRLWMHDYDAELEEEDRRRAARAART